MGIIKKRILAFLIDFFVLAGGIWLALTAFNLMWLFMLDYDSFILAMMLIVFKDCVFKNASLGKKLMRISVYNTHWRRPTFAALIKRTFYSHTIGLCLIVKIRFTNGSFSEFLEWEKKTTKTIVIDSDIYAKFKKEIDENGEDYSRGMTKRYNEYISYMYLK